MTTEIVTTEIVTTEIVTLLRFELLAEELVAVAAPEAAGAVDLPVLMNPNGQVWISPTTLAGSLRDHLGPGGLAKELMGSPPEADDLVPSRLSLLGTKVVDAADNGLSRGDITQRTQTAIDRSRGAARAHTLRTVQAIPAGSHIVLYGSVDGELTDEERFALASWRPLIGRAVTRGLGRMRLESLRLGTLDLSQHNDLDRWLTDGGPDLIEHVVAATEYELPDLEAGDDLWLRVPLEIVDGFFTLGELVRNKAKTAIEDDWPVIYGSSLKGILRSRMEYILRTVGEEACLEGTCGQCVPCFVFGYAGDTGARRGLVAVRSARITNDQDEPATTELRPHVAIDRVTGGTASGRLFSEKFVPAGRFELKIDDLSGDTPAWVRELLLWVVRDLDDGLVGVGGRATRGFGTVRVDSDPVRQELRKLQSVSVLVETARSEMTVGGDSDE